MIYLYGLLDKAPPSLTTDLADTPGLQAPLQVQHIGAWTLVYSEHDQAEIHPKRRLLLAHTRVVEKMVSLGTVLPARFGLVAESCADVTALIEGKAHTIASEFDRVSGCVELGLRVNFPRQVALTATLEAHPDLAKERDRLVGKGAKAHFAIAEFGGKLADLLDRRRSAAQAAMLNALAPFIQGHVLRAPEEDTEVLRAEFLVSRGAQPAFESAIEAAASALQFAPGIDPQIQLVGPVPMYNFVRLSLALEQDDEAA